MLKCRGLVFLPRRLFSVQHHPPPELGDRYIVERIPDTVQEHIILSS